MPRKERKVSPTTKQEKRERGRDCRGKKQIAGAIEKLALEKLNTIFSELRRLDYWTLWADIGSFRWGERTKEIYLWKAWARG